MISELEKYPELKELVLDCLDQHDSVLPRGARKGPLHDYLKKQKKRIEDIKE